MENAANWRTESRTVYSSDFKLRMVELASRPDANVAQLARNMALIIISFLSGYASGRERGESLVECLQLSWGRWYLNLFRLLRLCCPSTLSTTRCPQQRMTLCVRSPPLTPEPLPVMLSSAMGK